MLTGDGVGLSVVLCWMLCIPMAAICMCAYSFAGFAYIAPTVHKLVVVYG